jgi:hypothetical protein
MGLNPNALRQIVDTGIDAYTQATAKLKQAEGSIFEVTTISNGFIVTYQDIEEFETTVPKYTPRAPGHPRPTLGAPPEMETLRRWKIVVREVYCADGEAIKVQVDEALKLTEKVKQMKAQDVLSGGDDYLRLGTAVGA